MFGDGAAADQIKLVPSGAFGGGANVFKRMTGDGGERVNRARFAGGSGGGNFSAAMHHAAVTDGRENGGKGKIEGEDSRANVAFGHGDGPAGAESDVVEDAAIFAESDFAVSAAVEIVEDDARKAAFCHFAEIVDADDGGRKGIF